MAEIDELTKRVLIASHRRSDLNPVSPTYKTISDILLYEADSLGAKSYDFNTAYNVVPSEKLDSPGDKWHEAVKLDSVLTFQMPGHNYFVIKNVIENTSTLQAQTIFDNRSQNYLSAVILWKVIFRLSLIDLPPIAKDYIVARSAVRFLAGQDGDQVAIREAKEIEQRTLRELTISKINGQSVKDQDTPFNRLVDMGLRYGTQR